MRKTTEGSEKLFSKKTVIDSFELNASKRFKYFALSTPLKITCIYLFFGTLWILFSDKFVGLLNLDKNTIINIGIIKGIVYVFITGLLIYSLIFADFKKIRATQNELVEKCSELSTKNDELCKVYDELVTSEKELKHNYSTLKRSQEALRISEERYRLAIEGANDGIWDWDIKNDILEISSNWADFLGFDTTIIRNFKDLWQQMVHPDDIEEFSDRFDRQLEDKNNSSYINEYRLRVKNGSYIWVYSRGRILRNHKGKATRIAGSNTDITERMNMQAKYERMAYYDKLTGLSNKVMFTYNINLEIENCKKSDNKFAIVFLDVDNFKNINDTYGHDFGDKFLKRIAKVLKSMGKNGDVISRFDGDGYAILCRNVEDLNKVKNFVEKIIKRFNGQWNIEGKVLFSTVSIGITVYPDDGDNAETLLRNADTAMYKAKEGKNSSFVFFEKSLYFDLLKRTYMEKNLRIAINNEEFVMFYQPQFEPGTCRIMGMEALIRWIKPGSGVISPTEFIPIAEETGLIIDIGNWVFRTSCRQAKEFEKNLGLDIDISINVSVLQLKEEKFVDMVREVIIEEGIKPEKIIIEITESVIMENFESNRLVLNELRNLGVRIALDDFGTGYSSLSYLNQIPINEVKIDKSFIRNLNLDESKMTIVDTIIDLSHRLGLDVTAEGVEMEEELKFLKERKCDKIQGYIFSKPMNVEDIMAIYVEKKN